MPVSSVSKPSDARDFVFYAVVPMIFVVTSAISLYFALTRTHEFWVPFFWGLLAFGTLGALLSPILWIAYILERKRPSWSEYEERLLGPKLGMVAIAVFFSAFGVCLGTMEVSGPREDGSLHFALAILFGFVALLLSFVTLYDAIESKK